MRGYIFINPDVKNLYLNIMFDAYWKHNMDISNKKILISLVEKCKININNFFEGTHQNQKIKNELKNLTKEAHNKEIFGAPTFVVNNKLFCVAYCEVIYIWIFHPALNTYSSSALILLSFGRKNSSWTCKSSR